MASVFVLAACAQGPTRPPQFKDIRPVPPLFAQEIVTRRGAGGLTVRIYNTGSVLARGGAVSELKSWAAKVRLDFPAFLVRHPARGLVLFDTGFHPDMETAPAKKMGRINHLLVPFEVKPGQSIAAQLKRDGVGPDDVRWVVISHLHMDHAGSIEYFPNATILVDKREWEAQKERLAKKPDPRELDCADVEKRIKLRLVDFSAAAPYGAFDRGEDLFGDGTIILVDLAGHTPGSMGAWINLDSGPALLAGDASWVMDNHRDLALPVKSRIFDLDQYWRRLLIMRAMQRAAPQLVIFPGHDLSPLKLQPRPEISLREF